MIGIFSNSINFQGLDRLPWNDQLRKKPNSATVYSRSQSSSFTLKSFPGSSFLKKSCNSMVSSDSGLHTVGAIGRNGTKLIEGDPEPEAYSSCTRQINALISNEINKYVEEIRSMLSYTGDGETSVSAYDTAWVALIEDVNGSGAPQFPSCLQWIANNQLPDGSWGDAHVFSAYDRILSSLACLVALKTWNLHPDKYDKGLSFLNDNLCKLKDERAEHMTIGFEVAFPSLFEIARRLGIEVPVDSDVLQPIYDRRNIKLTRIPMDMIHRVPTTLLYSLEGIQGLNWEKILKLLHQDGSFLCSPSSVAFAFMQTKDEKCLRFLTKAVHRFKGAVPCVYQVDLFEPLWTVDRLQRLGISRYFELEIKQCVNHVYRHWKDEGISYGSNTFSLPDIDDTSMGFKILRLHGRQVSADVFRFFKKDGGFFCYPGQLVEGITYMLNFYRASQVRFPGEEILKNAEEFSSKFLKEKLATNELLDKWIICKDLPGEVRYALEVPWHANLPRVEARFYIEHYGGEDEVWIGKTLYRMPHISNNLYLDLAKLDFNSCQALHYIEWENFQKWSKKFHLRDFGISERTLLFAYFLAAANAFEPERSKERLAWAKTSIMLETIESFFKADNNSYEHRRAFVREFKNGIGMDRRNSDMKKTSLELVKMLHRNINHLSIDAVAHDRNVSDYLHQAWEKWLLKWEVEGDRYRGEAELLVGTKLLIAGYSVSEELGAEHHPQFEKLCKLTNRLCSHLGHYKKHNENVNNSCSTATDGVTTPETESDMQELVQLVLQNSSDGMDFNLKQKFLAVVKSFYYTAFCRPETINHHIRKVLFERVE